MDNDKSNSQPIDEEQTTEQPTAEPVAEPTPEETQAPKETPDAEPQEAESEQTQTTETPQPSKRENLRIQALVEKLRRKEEPPSKVELPEALDYKEKFNADENTISELEKDRQNFGENLYRQGQSEALKQVQSVQFHTRLEIDAPKVESKYPVMDKNSPEFNPGLADALNSWYLATAGYDPQSRTVENADIRYADFVEGVMEIANEIAGNKVAESTRNLTEQLSKTSIRPDASTQKGLDLSKAPQDMSDEELDAIISSSIK